MQMSKPMPPARPLLRGVIHGAAFPVAIVIGAILVVGAEDERGHLAAAIFAGSVALCFGISALYHRVTWSPPRRAFMRRLDHAGIYLLIAGTYTPVALFVLAGAWRWTIFAIAWTAAAVAIAQPFLWATAPKWLSAVVALVIGWGSVVVLPQTAARLGPVGSSLLVAGGLVYSLGAIVYVRRRPDPLPRIFGYHELFHALTIVAAACQYVAIAFYVLRVD